ncbi:MAG: hypothetical protein IH995_09880 [Proteobacteria bacterium]|nr:hypothetical protein [Pseudomonadota bacterium]
MLLDENLKFYPDTNFLWGIKPSELIFFLDKCKAEKIQVSISEVVLWEYSRKLFQAAVERPKTPTIHQMSDSNKGDSLLRHFETNNQLFRSCKVKVLSLKTEHRLLAKKLINAGDFNGDVPNDVRDALILATAVCDCDPANFRIVCSDGNLKNQFDCHGFKAVEDVKAFRASLSETSKSPDVLYPDPEKILKIDPHDIMSKVLLDALPEIEPQYGIFVLKYLERPSTPQTEEIQTNLGSLTPWLDVGGAQDREIKTRILGYAYLGDPAPKAEILDFLTQDGYPDEGVLRNTNYIISQGILVEIGHFLVPNENNPNALKICEDAGHSTLEEFIQKVEGD